MLMENENENGRKSRNFCNFFFRNKIVFNNSHLLLPATYTLKVLIDIPLLINVSIFFASLPALMPILQPLTATPPPFIIFSNLFEPVFLSFTLTDMHGRYSQILLIFFTLIVVWGQFLYSETRQTEFELGCPNSTLSVFPPSLSKIWKNFTPPVVICLFRPMIIKHLGKFRTLWTELLASNSWLFSDARKEPAIISFSGGRSL